MGRKYDFELRYLKNQSAHEGQWWLVLLDFSRSFIWAQLVLSPEFPFNLADTLGWDIKVSTKHFALKTCENCPKTGYQLWYKLDKANNAYFYFSWTNCPNCKKTMKYCYFFVTTDTIFDISFLSSQMIVDLSVGYWA